MLSPQLTFASAPSHAGKSAHSQHGLSTDDFLESYDDSFRISSSQFKHARPETHDAQDGYFCSSTNQDSFASPLTTKEINDLQWQHLNNPESLWAEFNDPNASTLIDQSIFEAENITQQPQDPSMDPFMYFLQSSPENHASNQTPEPQSLDLDQSHELPNIDEIPICWEHGCNGKVFSSWSNLRRHERERASQAPRCYCPRCGAYFSRTTARNQHLANMSCTRIRRYSNGRTRLSMKKIQDNFGFQL